jgi:hypothetical protein
MIGTMIRRLAALALAAILLAGNLAAVDCAGWQPSPSDRMACCIKAEHGCPDQLAADQCCAASESLQQLTVTSVAAALPGPAVAPAALPPFVLAASIVPIFRSLSDHPQSPPHFRRTVLLI